MTLDPVVIVTLRFGLAALFAAAAVHKLRDMRRFLLILFEYRVLPAPSVAAVGRGVVAAELVTCALLLAPATARLGAATAAALLLVYTSAIVVNLARGRRDMDCGCEGAAGGQRLSGGLVVRNVALVGCAVLGAAPSTLRVLTPTDALTVGGTLLSAALLWRAMATLGNLRRAGSARASG